MQKIKLLNIADGIFVSSGARSVGISSELRNSNLWAGAKLDKDGIAIEDDNIRRADIIPRSVAENTYTKIEFEIQQILMESIVTHFPFKFDGIEGSQIVRYKRGGMFTPHRDSGRIFPERALTIIKYLSKDYLGGETIFPNSGVNIPVSCPEYVIFLPELLHSSTPVISGEKYIFLTWLIKKQISW